MPDRFQSFDDISDRAASRPRMAALRAELARRSLSGFVLPRADRHQNEYVPPADERLAWLTGFTGSAGLAIVLESRAVLFVDGRYTLQAAEQVDDELFEIVHLAATPPDTWIEANLGGGRMLGYDPWLHTIDGADKLAKACAAAGATLVATDSNPLDAIWTDRPGPPLGAVTLHDERFAGEPASAKLARLGAEIAKTRADALVVSDPHAICWLFNIRGADVAHTPITLAFAIVPARGPSCALYRRPQADQRRPRRPRRHRRSARAGRLRRRPRGTRRGEPHRAARSGRHRRCHPAVDRRERRQDRARRRSDRDDEGGQELSRDRRRARGASARRRRGHPLPRLVRSHRAGGPSSPKSTRSRRSRTFAATPACSRTSRFRPSRVPGRTAPSCTIA